MRDRSETNRFHPSARGHAITLALATALLATSIGVIVPRATALAGTSSIVPYGSAGYRYQQVAHDAGAGFEAPGFDDSGWATGTAPFGFKSDVVNCPLDGTITTAWAANTDLLVRRTFSVPADATQIVVGIAIDDQVQVWINGHDVSAGMQPGNNCASQDNQVFQVPAGDLVVGDNVLAVRGRDTGDTSYLDMSIRATVPDATTTTLTSSLNPSTSTQGITFTATVTTTTGGAAAGEGSLSITDETTSTTLATANPIAPTGVLAVTVPPMSVGGHHLVASYTGAGAFASSTGSLDQVVTLDSAVTASGLSTTPSTFYPVVDGYRDLETIRGHLDEAATVTIRIYGPTGSIVRTLSLGTKMGSYSTTWNGRSSGGTLLAAGKYRIVQTLIDAAANKLTATSYVNLSRKKLTWYTSTKTLYGSQFTIHGDPGDGSVSTTRSSFYRGVRLTSGHAWVAVAYTFTVPSATVYKTVTFKTYGRSPNRTGAVIGIWNPALGSYVYVEHYDALKVAGPGLGWYSTTASANTHRSGRTVHAMVFAPYAGGVTSFDVAKVTLLCRYAILK